MKLDLQQVADCIENQTEPEQFSGVVYLTAGDEVLFERACGFGTRSESIPNTVNTRFQMASGRRHREMKRGGGESRVREGRNRERERELREQRNKIRG